MGQSSTWEDVLRRCLGGAHVYVISGKLRVRDGMLSAGDYVYEPSGVLHDATAALEDTVDLFICDGMVLYLDHSNFPVLPIRRPSRR
jgi:hypothetical protein